MCGFIRTQQEGLTAALSLVEYDDFAAPDNWGMVAEPGRTEGDLESSMRDVCGDEDELIAGGGYWIWGWCLAWMAVSLVTLDDSKSSSVGATGVQMAHAGTEREVSVTEWML